MIFFCLVDTKNSAVPHMELMPVETLEEARIHARRLLGNHEAPVAAHIFMNDQRLDTLTA